MSHDERVVYLDYAATAAVRPPSVIRAITGYLESNGATPGRGGHRLAVAADRIALACRQSLARLLDIPGDPGRIAFFFNATYAINAAISGVVNRGERIVTTALDHNAVLRPARALAESRGADVIVVDADTNGVLDDVAFDRALDGARLVVINAVSNVLGTAFDVESMTKRAHAAGALVLVDAAQAAGEVPVSVREWDADMVAFTGHKGLLGPHGTGALWVRDGVDVRAFASGGTGGDSTDVAMPAAYPDHLEAGSQNGAGIAGLHAGASWLLEADVTVVCERTHALARILRDGLDALDGVHVLSPERAVAPIVTCVAESVDPATIAARLDAEFGVLVRAGLHCAPEAHRILGTLQTGAVRFSAGWATTREDIDHAIMAMDVITGPRVHAAATPTSHKKINSTAERSREA
jgi:selenocysteine lyase/cysteine desulfurase